jgi:hypothetical protein
VTLFYQDENFIKGLVDYLRMTKTKLAIMICSNKDHHAVGDITRFCAGEAEEKILAMNINGIVSGLNIQICRHIIFTAPFLESHQVDPGLFALVGATVSMPGS